MKTSEVVVMRDNGTDARVGVAVHSVTGKNVAPVRGERCNPIMPSVELEVSKERWPITEYGTIDVSCGVPDGLIHVKLPRLGPTCKRLGIECGKAIVDWNEVGSQRNKKNYSILSGIVIKAVDHARLTEALKEKEEVRRQKADRLPVLTALFTLNRRAKRCRDLGQKYYQNKLHGFAGKMKTEKDRIYQLKGQVLQYMIDAGTLVGGKFHRFEFGNWAEVLEGAGYRFHRPCPQQELLDETLAIESIEAKPKESKEPALALAFEVVEGFLKGKSEVRVYQWPSVTRKRRKYNWHDDDDGEDDYGDEDRDDDEYER